MTRSEHGNLSRMSKVQSLGGALSVKSVNVGTKYRNQTQRIIGLIITLTVNVAENV